MAAVADLETISLDALKIRDRGELTRLVRAAASPGIFYLYIGTEKDCTPSPLVKLLPEMYQLTRDYFEQDQTEKERDVRNDQRLTQERGYKRDSLGNTFEAFEMANDELFSGNLELPKVLAPHADLCTAFSKECNFLCSKILACLADGLGRGFERLNKLHQCEGETSDSGLKLLYKPNTSVIGNSYHMDRSTLTIRFHHQWDLEAMFRDAGRWKLVPDLRGRVVVSIGSTLQQLAGHRVHAPFFKAVQSEDGDDDDVEKRVSFLYYLRPIHALEDPW